MIKNIITYLVAFAVIFSLPVLAQAEIEEPLPPVHKDFTPSSFYAYVDVKPYFSKRNNYLFFGLIDKDSGEKISWKVDESDTIYGVRTTHDKVNEAIMLLM